MDQILQGLWLGLKGPNAMMDPKELEKASIVGSFSSSLY